MGGALVVCRSIMTCLRRGMDTVHGHCARQVGWFDPGSTHRVNDKVVGPGVVHKPVEVDLLTFAGHIEWRIVHQREGDVAFLYCWIEGGNEWVFASASGLVSVCVCERKRGRERTCVRAHICAFRCNTEIKRDTRAGLHAGVYVSESVVAPATWSTPNH
jgi:hypothetical protein